MPVYGRQAAFAAFAPSPAIPNSSFAPQSHTNLSVVLRPLRTMAPRSPQLGHARCLDMDARAVADTKKVSLAATFQSMGMAVPVVTDRRPLRLRHLLLPVLSATPFIVYLKAQLALGREKRADIGANRGQNPPLETTEGGGRSDCGVSIDGGSVGDSGVYGQMVGVMVGESGV